jgi:hypothetical protein
MYKYQIWCEAGLLYDSEENSQNIYDDPEEAEVDAKADVESYIESAEFNATEEDYWYEIEEV